MRLFILASAILFVFCIPFPSKCSPLRAELDSESDDLQQWSMDQTIGYLGKFGYLPKRYVKRLEVGSLIDGKSYRRAIRKFQKMMGLRPSGEMNSETQRLMQQPRCGVTDERRRAFSGGDNGDSPRSSRRSSTRRRSKRYALQGGRWTKNVLKYHILNYTPDLTRSQTQTAIRRAFEIWSNYTNLEFYRTSDPSRADIKISFETGDHGDFWPFDRKGNELAHAYYPSDGRVHFNDYKRFTVGGKGNGVDLLYVAAHEFGHTLGLYHSSTRGALMTSTYTGYKPNLTLHPDDIKGIQRLYGKKTTDICQDRMKFDAMHYDHRESVLYAFKGKHFWKINDEGVLRGYPKSIHMVWNHLPSDISASAYSRTTGRTYFFKGGKIWRYDERKRLERGFPQPVSALGLPSDPDAAVQWRRDGMIYVFKGDHFYRFSEYQRYGGGNHYGNWRIDLYWRDLPSNLDAAFNGKNGNTFFVKGDRVWSYQRLGTPLTESYPKNFKTSFLKCEVEDVPLARRIRTRKAGRRNRWRPNRM